MSDAAPTPVARKRSWRRNAVLFLGFALVCLGIFWAMHPKRVTAVALFEVHSDTPSLVGNPPAQPNGKLDYEILRKTQIALLKSKFVLTSALVNPAVAGLPVLAGKPDPSAWLQDHLEVSFPQNGEILELKLRGSKSEADDLRQLVDAVAVAYKKEVLGNERQRKLTIRDMVAKSLENLNSELKRKYEDYIDISKGLGRPEGENSEIQQQLMVKRLDRIDDELMQLERELWKLAANDDSKNSKDDSNNSKLMSATKQRFAELTKRREALQRELEIRITKSVELVTRKSELEQLQKLSNDMSMKLEQLDIDMEAPPQIRQIQPAIIEPSQVAAGYFWQLHQP